MINLTPAFKQKLFNDERDYLEYADITLENNTVLHLTNANFWQNGFSIEDSIGEDNTFSALGAAVVNSCTLVINNIYDDFTEYDFTNAKVVVSVGMELPNPQNPSTTYIERAWKGTFMVDEATYNGSLITLKCLDDMAQFDRPYSESTLTYPATLGDIVRDACDECLGSSSMLGTQQFPHYDYSIPTRPEDEKTTFREVVSWCATIAGCFARFAYYSTANNSKLELKWFNTQVFEDRAEGTDGGEFDANSTAHYTTGDTLDGGTFNPWNTGDVADAGSFTDERPFHHISSLYNHNIGVDDIVITGVSATIKVEIVDDDTTKSELDKRLVGTEGYVIDIAQNDFVTETNVNEILTWLGDQLIGLTFRKASVTHPSDPSIEAGDIAFVYDRKGNEYPILVTRTVFNGFGMQTTVCGAETPNRNSGTRYSEITKSYVELRKKVKRRAGDAYARAMEALQDSLDNASGLYVTEVQQTGGGVITFLHNKPNPTAAQGIFEFPSDSNIVIMVSSAGIVVTNEGDTGGQNVGDRSWYGLQVDGTLIATILNTIGVNADWINAGTLSANYIKGGTLTLGGNNNGNGQINVYASDGTTLIGRWDKDGAYIIGDLILRNSIGGRLWYASIDEITTHYYSDTITRGGLRLSSKYGTLDEKVLTISAANSGNTSGGGLRNIIDSADPIHIRAGSGQAWGALELSGGDRFNYTTPYGNAYMERFYVNYNGNGGVSGNWTYGGTIGQSSDERLKKDIQTVDEKYLEAIHDVEIIQYKYTDETKGDKPIVGVVAQDVIRALNDVGINHKDRSVVMQSDEDGYYNVNYIDFLTSRIAYDEKVMQEQQDEINDLKSRIEKLEKLVDQLL